MKLFLLIIGLACIGHALSDNSIDLNEEFKNYQKTMSEIQSRNLIITASPHNSTVCFDFEGCFSNTPPFTNTGYYLPMHPDDLQTEILLLTRKNTDVMSAPVLNYKDANSLIGTNFDSKLPLKIIIHGFSNDRTAEWISQLANAILQKENVNVLVVDWGKGATFPLYNNASTNTRLVGRQVGLFVNLIREKFYASNPRVLNVHCIGHSLGAHTCGYASNAAKIRFNRISGLDTAGPFFEETDPLVRLDPTDADFIDAIHTNAGTLLSASFGIQMTVGHVDFFPNGGWKQPGCPSLTGVIGGLIGGAANPTDEVGCHHGRAHTYFIESILSSCTMLAFQCESSDAFNRGDCVSCDNNKCSVMGYNSDKYKARGSFYLMTNADPPHCGYHHLFEMKISSDSPKTAGEVSISINKETNNSPKPLTGSSDDIKAGSTIKKIFVTEHDMIHVNSVDLKFSKKAKPFIGSDSNSVRFSFDKIKLTNVGIDEQYTSCNKNTLVDKQVTNVPIIEGDCSAKSFKLANLVK